MIRGFRGATTVEKNNAEEILKETKKLIIEMVNKNNIKPMDISHVFFSVTEDINAVFPAKAAREMDGWSYVPVMCMKEIDVPNSLEKCIRIMLVANTDIKQQDIEHVFLNGAQVLRPDLVKEKSD